ncbi:glycoside hydrolase family 2 TIM barrel-domain containing protein [Aegicerativicinus sediminis]|uniref:glycoside hydrolase family 2 TIM barrel-domain containing protein n=1 Tax=Aegicerativicinus sediminis TaxID=2893202 RepID=UPI001E554FF4|nr:glycoside hydrolase family 2 TIM barrel-domain containing protein [Aegicerativicinus sediminis]
MRNNLLITFITGCLIFSCVSKNKKAPEPKETQTGLVTKNERWSEEKANFWEEKLPWLRGSNFNPSTAINQLEFWQKETFDPETIDKELGWAENIGLNCMRVYLHHVAWQFDKEGFKERINHYLSIADKHNIATIFVFFDDCWNPTYSAGKQPDPKPGVHNSGWIRDPGDLLFTSENLLPTLEAYTKDILSTFKDDKRIILWDLYNEPGNSGYGNKSMNLLKKVFEWGREINPTQPLTAGVWNFDLKDLNKFQIENSDIITYHNYNDEIHHQSAIDTLKKLNRPLICTEYMARRNNSLFGNIMPILKKQHIGAINWGLVAGKSNTKYAWDEPIPDGSEPKLWFHEIFRKDGTPYKQEEVDIIKELTKE